MPVSTAPDDLLQRGIYQLVKKDATSALAALRIYEYDASTLRPRNPIETFATTSDGQARIWIALKQLGRSGPICIDHNRFNQIVGISGYKYESWPYYPPANHADLIELDDDENEDVDQPT